MLFDSHAHLNFEEFQGDWKDVVADCQKNGVWMVNVGSQLQTSCQAVSIAEKYSEGVYAAIGLHPIHAPGSNFHPENFDLNDYRHLIGQSKKIVAIGEIGIDFFHGGENFASQKEIFVRQLHLAKDGKLPVIVHARNGKSGADAYDEILKIIKAEKISEGVIHCFGGSADQAREFASRGFYVGFTGIITFDKTGATREAVAGLPLETILIETDCPWLAPIPHRGERNLPQYVRFVAEKIAEIKDISYNEVSEATAKNAINLFKI